jgi:glycine cleavage system H protein
VGAAGHRHPPGADRGNRLRPAVPRRYRRRRPAHPGEKVAAGEPSGDIESVKSVNDLITPVTDTVRARNEDLADAPDLVNTDPYGLGWMLEIETGPATIGQQLAALTDAAAYRELTGA